VRAEQALDFARIDLSKQAENGCSEDQASSRRIPKHDESCQTALGVDLCILFGLGLFFTGITGVETAPVPFSPPATVL
jgi:hypothetical protein